MTVLPHDVKVTRDPDIDPGERPLFEGEPSPKPSPKPSPGYLTSEQLEEIKAGRGLAKTASALMAETLLARDKFACAKSDLDKELEQVVRDLNAIDSQVRQCDLIIDALALPEDKAA